MAAADYRLITEATGQRIAAALEGVEDNMSEKLPKDFSTLPTLPSAPASGDELAIERGTNAYKIDYNALADAIVAKTQSGLAIIVDGDTASMAVPVGGYAYIRNNTHGLAEGLYTNTSSSAFPASGGTANASVFTSVSGGGLNALNSVVTKQSFSLTLPSGWIAISNMCYAIGNMVFISGLIRSTTILTTKKINIGNCIPDAYCSRYRVGFAAFNNTTDNVLHGLLDSQNIVFYRSQTEDLDTIEFSLLYII